MSSESSDSKFYAFSDCSALSLVFLIVLKANAVLLSVDTVLISPFKYSWFKCRIPCCNLPWFTDFNPWPLLLSVQTWWTGLPPVYATSCLIRLWTDCWARGLWGSVIASKILIGWWYFCSIGSWFITSLGNCKMVIKKKKWLNSRRNNNVSEYLRS